MARTMSFKPLNRGEGVANVVDADLLAYLRLDVCPSRMAGSRP
jgi:hypothetical protein